MGNNGQPKQYYACAYCDRINSWKSIACCKEHFDLYIEEELERKSMLNKINMLPKRIDMSEDEIKELYNIPADVVLEKTNQELQYYKDRYGIDNINEVVDKINDELNKEGRL